MYIIKNALENLMRNKGRNILIAAIIFAIITTTVVGLIINNTSTAVIEDYQNRFSSEVSITPDFNKVREQAMANSSNGRVAMRMPTISPELLLSFTQSEDLSKYDASGFLTVDSTQITAIDQSEDTTDITTGNAAGINAGNGGGAVMMAGGNGNYRLYGDYWKDFDDGSRALVDDGISSFPQADNECVISQDLADLNNLKVGDTLTFTGQLMADIPADADMSSYSDGDTYEINGEKYTLTKGLDESFRATRDVVYTLKVTGIYTDLTDAYANENMPKMAALNRRNEVLTNLNTLLAPRKTNENNISINVTYYLKNPDLLGDFESYVRSKGLSDMFIVSTDTNSYNTIVKPVLGLKSISLAFMIIVLVLGAIILLLLTSIAVRERKYEIGVLRAMGMKKIKVSLGLWTELLVITIICLIVGIGAGSAASQPITNALIAQQASAASNENTQQGPMGMITMGSGTMMRAGLNSNAKPLSNMQVTIGINTILEIIGIALFLASLAGLLSTSKITKYEPIKILMERN